MPNVCVYVSHKKSKEKTHLTSCLCRFERETSIFSSLSSIGAKKSAFNRSIRFGWDVAITWLVLKVVGERFEALFATHVNYSASVRLNRACVLRSQMERGGRGDDVGAFCLIGWMTNGPQVTSATGFLSNKWASVIIYTKNTLVFVLIYEHCIPCEVFLLRQTLVNKSRVSFQTPRIQNMTITKRHQLKVVRPTSRNGKWIVFRRWIFSRATPRI